MMQIDQSALVMIVWAVLSGFCVMLLGIIAFFLKAVYSSVITRLDSIEKTLSDHLGELKAGNVITASNTAEINILRSRYHDLANEQQLQKGILEKCKKCSGM
jgi:hypothetical protein